MVSKVGKRRKGGLGQKGLQEEELEELWKIKRKSNHI